MSAVDVESRVRHQNFWFVACFAVLVIQIAVEYMMGRVPHGASGYVNLCEGGVKNKGNKHHKCVMYKPSHIIHGFLFYGLAHLILRRKPLAAKLLLALVIESGWELLENSPLIIDRYRTATIALDYYGDSILNSAMDTVFMCVGFFFARRAPVALTVAIATFFEIFTGYIIRDNLTLNVVMLIWPVEAIKVWQGGV